MAGAAVEQVERVLRWHPWPSQKLFHGIHARHKGFSGPVGSGKSLALVYEAIRLSVVNPGRLGLIGAPTYPMLRDITQRALFDELEEAGIPFRFYKQENRMILEDMGSEIIFRSLDNPERLRGTNLAWFGIDEMTYCQEDAFLRLQSRLRDPLAAELCGFGVWTPNGFDWVYRKFIDHARKDLNYVAVLAKPGENRKVAETGMYEQLKGSYDERFYRQEVLGEYLSFSAGAAYYAFDRAENVKPLEYDPTLPLCWSLDFNVDPMTSVIGQIVDESTSLDRAYGRQVLQFRILDEIFLRGVSVPDACQAFADKTEKWRAGYRQIPVNVYGDATGSAREKASAGSPTCWGAVREFFSVAGRQFAPTYCYREQNPLVRDRINAVNAQLCNALEQRHLFIDPVCKHLIDDLERVTWKDGTAIPDPGKDRMLTHISDALGYLVETEAGAKSSGGWRRDRII
jgi:hypothetical protein